MVEKALIDMTFEKREKLIARDNRREGMDIGLKCIIEMLNEFLSDFNQIYERVIKNEAYHDYTESEVRRIWDEVSEEKKRKEK